MNGRFAARLALGALSSIILSVVFLLLVSANGMRGIAWRPTCLPSGPETNMVLVQRRGEHDDLRKGRFLVATPDLQDPNFAETAVLLVEYGEMGAMGIVINRITKVRLTAVLPEIDLLKQSNEMLFLGGPVARSGIAFLFHSETAPQDAQGVFGKVYVSASRELLERVVSDAGQYRHYRVFAGHSGWAPGQLEAEIDAGAWNVVSADTRSVFDPAPAGVWPRLIDRTNLRLAGLVPATADQASLDLFPGFKKSGTANRALQIHPDSADF